MKDPRHQLNAKNECKRCGLSKRWGKYCPVGYWATRAQSKLLDAPDLTLLGMDRLERKWLAEWRATQRQSKSHE